jgi:hypothetical protein
MEGLLLTVFASNEEQGRGISVGKARSRRQLSKQMWDVLVGLLVCGFQFSGFGSTIKRDYFKESFANYLLDLFGSFCSSG